MRQSVKYILYRGSKSEWCSASFWQQLYAWKFDRKLADMNNKANLRSRRIKQHHHPTKQNTRRDKILWDTGTNTRTSSVSHSHSFNYHSCHLVSIIHMLINDLVLAAAKYSTCGSISTRQHHTSGHLLQTLLLRSEVWFRQPQVPYKLCSFITLKHTGGECSELWDMEQKSNLSRSLDVYFVNCFLAINKTRDRCLQKNVGNFANVTSKGFGIVILYFFPLSIKFVNIWCASANSDVY